jgi:hypothetical protein
VYPLLPLDHSQYKTLLAVPESFLSQHSEEAQPHLLNHPTARLPSFKTHTRREHPFSPHTPVLGLPARNKLTQAGHSGCSIRLAFSFLSSPHHHYLHLANLSPTLPTMGLFSQKAAVDTRTYETGANKWNQNSRAYLLALIACSSFLPFLHPCSLRSTLRC